MKKGLEGRFKSPINGDSNFYDLRIYESLLEEHLKNLTLFDENERYALYLGETNIMVVKNK